MAQPLLLRRLSGALALVPLVAIGLSAAGCTGKDPFSPGTKLGSFHVAAKLSHSTCGPAPDPWTFDVRLNHDGATLYWVQGGAPIEGRVDGAARATLASEVVVELRAADPRGHLAACAVARTDTLALVLHGADGAPAADPADAAGFTGSLSYAFAPTTDSECADQLTAAGGGFDALPCAIQYELAATRDADPR